MSKYVHNKSTAKVSLINGKITLGVGEKSHISAKDIEHDDVSHALHRGWISVEGVESATAIPEASKGPEIKQDPMQGSLTIPGKEPEVSEVPEVSADTQKPAKKTSK